MKTMKKMNEFARRPVSVFAVGDFWRGGSCASPSSWDAEESASTCGVLWAPLISFWKASLGSAMPLPDAFVKGEVSEIKIYLLCRFSELYFEVSAPFDRFICGSTIHAN